MKKGAESDWPVAGMGGIIEWRTVASKWGLGQQMAAALQTEIRDGGVSLVAIIAAYNARDTVAQAIESLADDSLVRLIIVVDDGSTDGTSVACETAREEMKHPDRLIVLGQDNAGPSGARNTGLDRAVRASGWTHAVFLDADDLWMHGAGLAVADRLREHPRTAIAVGGREEFVAGRDEDGTTIAPPWRWCEAPMSDRSLVFEPVPFFGASGMIVSRSVVEAGVRFDEAMRVSEDRDFACRALAHGPLLVMREVVLRVAIHHDRHSANLTGAAQMQRWLADHAYLVSKHRTLPGADDRLRRQTDWLLNHALRCASQGRCEPMSDAMWQRYRALYREAGWRLPWKVVRRRWMLGAVMRLFDRAGV